MGSTVLLIGINFLIIFFIFLFFRSRINRFIKSSLFLEQLRNEVDSLVIELNQTTNRNIGLIEERLDRLKELLEKADKSIHLLSKKSEQTKEETRVYTDLKKNVPLFGAQETDDVLEPSLGEKVKRMYLDGVKKETIASKLDVTLSEVDLMLSIEMARD